MLFQRKLNVYVSIKPDHFGMKSLNQIISIVKSLNHLKGFNLKCYAISEVKFTIMCAQFSLMQRLAFPINYWSVKEVW